MLFTHYYFDKKMELRAFYFQTKYLIVYFVFAKNVMIERGKRCSNKTFKALKHLTSQTDQT